MADFGPKIFHALAYLADANVTPGKPIPRGVKRFKTRDDVTECGFSKTEIDINQAELDVKDTVETLKNAIFKTLMMRVRNQLVEQHREGGDTKQCAVSLELKVSSTFLHGQKETNDKASAADALLGGENGIVSIELDNLFPDSQDSITLAAALAAVCASNIALVDQAFNGDPVYAQLPNP